MNMIHELFILKHIVHITLYVHVYLIDYGNCSLRNISRLSIKTKYTRAFQKMPSTLIIQLCMP